MLIERTDSLMPSKKQQSLLLKSFLASIVFFLLAHAYAAANLAFSGKSLAVNAATSAAMQLETGNWLAPLYIRLRGSISAPYLVSLLSCLFLSCFVTALVFLFRLDTLPKICSLAGIVMLNPAVTAQLCENMLSADAVFLSLALSAFAVVLLPRFRWGWAASAVLLAVASSLSFPTCSAGLILLILFILIFRPEECSSVLLKGLAAQLLAWMAYAAGSFLMLRRSGVETALSLRALLSGTLPAALAAPVRSYFSAFTAYPVPAFIITLLLVLSAVYILLKAPESPAYKACVLIFLFLIIPALCVFPLLISSQSLQVSPVYLFFGIGCFLILVCRSEPGRFPGCVRQAMSACLSVLFLGQIIFSNQVYLKKDLEYQSTLSAMNRVLQKLETTEGFVPGRTKVALLGTIEESAVSSPHKGFEHLETFEAASHRFAAYSENLNTAYFWQIMGYPLNLVSDFERDQIAKDPRASALPSFPSPGCTAWLDDVLVLRLSPAQ